MEEFEKSSPAWETVLDVDALGKEEGESWVWAGTTRPDLGPGVETSRSPPILLLRSAVCEGAAPLVLETAPLCMAALLLFLAAAHLLPGRGVTWSGVGGQGAGVAVARRVGRNGHARV
eukprot:2481586-Rhodomonas_salina.2